VLDRAFDARGAEALSPAVDQRGFAAFLYEEVTWPHVTFQFGGRIDHTRFAPAGEPGRQFTNGSGSIGLLVRPAGTDDRVTIAASLARAARNPALEEMFFFGVHHGNFALEVGNPSLESEQALGFDLSVRLRSSRVSGEVTYFRNDISDYIFRRNMDHAEFEAREDEFVSRFGGREAAGHEHEGGEGTGSEDAEELAIVEFIGADALLQGIESHVDLQVTPQVALELGADYVRGTLQQSGAALPRIPPFRARAGLRYQRNAFQAGGELVASAGQDRVALPETPTEAYQALRLFTSYSFQAGRALNTLTARLDNATDELYRNHLSLIKHLVPEMGRNFKVTYNVSF
jgi:iron complex outermembrane receptor protein